MQDEEILLLKKISRQVAENSFKEYDKKKVDMYIEKENIAIDVYANLKKEGHLEQELLDELADVYIANYLPLLIESIKLVTINNSSFLLNGYDDEILCFLLELKKKDMISFVSEYYDVFKSYLKYNLVIYSSKERDINHLKKTKNIGKIDPCKNSLVKLLPVLLREDKSEINKTRK